MDSDLHFAGKYVRNRRGEDCATVCLTQVAARSRIGLKNKSVPVFLEISLLSSA